MPFREAAGPTLEEVRRELEKLQRRFGDAIRVNVVQVPADPVEGPPPPPPPEERVRLEFSHLPKDVKAFLDRYVIRQDAAKRALAIAICDHYNRIRDWESDPGSRAEDFTKQNILLIGPTGVGKTYLVRNIAKLIGVPFVKADATKFSETGYVGGNVDDLIRDLVTQANGDLELASYGIVYLDEIDKIAGSQQMFGRDVSGRGVQMGLLKLLEETDVDVRAPFDLQSQIRSLMEAQGRGNKREVVNTRHILFIVSGAFNGLKDIIERRMNRSRVGFDASSERLDRLAHLEHLRTEDLIQFGFEPEFVGRLPVRVACHELEKADLREILVRSEGSILRQYERAFRAYGLDVRFTEDGLEAIALLAHAEGTGARGLATVLERILRDYKFELSGSGMPGFVVDAGLVEAPARTLERILQDPAPYSRRLEALRVHAFSDEYFRFHGVRLSFDSDACDAVAELAVARGKTAQDVCEVLFKNFALGLGLIERNSGRTEFTITRPVVQNPDLALESWIRDSYARVMPAPAPTSTPTPMSAAEPASLSGSPPETPVNPQVPGRKPRKRTRKSSDEEAAGSS